MDRVTFYCSSDYVELVIQNVVHVGCGDVLLLVDFLLWRGICLASLQSPSLYRVYTVW